MKIDKVFKARAITGLGLKNRKLWLLLLFYFLCWKGEVIMKNTKKVKHEKSLNEKPELENNSELTIEQERESARESFWQDPDIDNKIVHENGDENELTQDDARDEGFALIQSEDEIEKYKP
jgi:hypothetical protein